MTTSTSASAPGLPLAAPVPRITSFLTAVLCFAATNAPTVLYGIWREEMAFSSTIQTLVYAIYVAGMIPALVMTGRWLRSYSPRQLMLIATGLSLVAAVLLSVADHPGWLLVGRFGQGLGMGVVMSASSYALPAAIPVRSHTLTALLITLTAIGGSSAGPIITGMVADLADRNTTISMLSSAVLLIIAIVLLVFHGASNQPAKPHPVEPVATTQTRAAVVHPRGLLLISLTAGISWSVVGMYQSVGPSLLSGALNVQALTLLGTIVAIVLLVAGGIQIVFRKVAVPVARPLGLIFLVLGMAGFATMLLTGHLWLALIASVGVGVSHGFIFLSATQEMGALIQTNPVQGGAWMSRYFATAYTCMAVFTVGLGIVGDMWTLEAATVVLLSVIAAASILMLFSRQPQPESQ